MEWTANERKVMERFAYKTHMAGGAKPGYMLRLRAIAAEIEEGAEEGVSSLVEKGVLAVSEGGEFVYLTEAGVEAL